ncbi:protein of unknown function [Cardinium endosymbiont cEper1 of Encarsia pergandiella]|nr:protein of unknown function [Cardinium endosymbiont cEper1 of Encarsia pergandiella]
MLPTAYSRNVVAGLLASPTTKFNTKKPPTIRNSVLNDSIHHFLLRIESMK